MDLAVRHGTLVTATSTMQADIGVSKGKIVQIGGSVPAAAKEVDATGRYVMPGAIDMHTHMDMPFMGTATSDDFETGTRAAAAGGVTTIIDFAIQPEGKTLADTVAIWDDKARGRALIDYSFHVALTRWDDSTPSQVEELIESGLPSFKVFMAYKGALMLEDAGLLQLLQVTGRKGGLVMVHAENGDAVATLQRQAIMRGERAPRSHAATRPRVVEGEATARAIALAHLADAPLYVVHVSCEEAVYEIARARRRGDRVYAESCPQYLGAISVEDYDRPDFEGAKFVCSPPLRDRDQADRIWDALSSGVLQIVSSDHCPFTTEQKRSGVDDFTLIPNGVPGVETLVPLVWTLGVHSGRISMNRFVQLVSTEPARRFGLRDKGDLAIGADADLMLLDPSATGVLSARSLHQNVDYTPYEGFEYAGRVTTTVSRGEVVWDGKTIHGRPGRGLRVHRREHDA